MRRRHALVVGLAGLTAACARSSSAPPTAVPPTPLPARTPSLQSVAAATPLTTVAPTAPVATATVAATPSPAPESQVALDVHLWNGDAEVQLEDGRAWVRDLGSTNGTEVANRPGERWDLRDGDTISLGGFQLTFRRP